MIDLNDRFRINDIGDQWLIERRKTPISPWFSAEWYCRTRTGLLLGIQEKCGGVKLEAMAAVLALPDYHPGRAAEAPRSVLQRFPGPGGTISPPE